MRQLYREEERDYGKFGGFSGHDIYKGYYSSIGICLEQTFNGERMETSRQSSSGGTYVTPVEIDQD